MAGHLSQCVTIPPISLLTKVSYLTWTIFTLIEIKKSKSKEKILKNLAEDVRLHVLNCSVHSSDQHYLINHLSKNKQKDKRVDTIYISCSARKFQLSLIS